VSHRLAASAICHRRRVLLMLNGALLQVVDRANPRNGGEVTSLIGIAAPTDARQVGSGNRAMQRESLGALHPFFPALRSSKPPT
jgi:hypothetical protein